MRGEGGVRKLFVHHIVERLTERIGVECWVQKPNRSFSSLDSRIVDERDHRSDDRNGSGGALNELKFSTDSNGTIEGYK